MGVRTSDDKLWHLSTMVEKAKAKGRGKKPRGTPRQRRGVKLRPTELGGPGRALLASYLEPLGGHALMLTALPGDKVVPTPFQRDISDAHVRKLTQAMDK